MRWIVVFPSRSFCAFPHSQQFNAYPFERSDEYIHAQIKKGARVLKLVQVHRPKYTLFGPSVASTGYQTSRQILGSLLRKLQILVEGGTLSQSAQLRPP